VPRRRKPRSQPAGSPPPGLHGATRLIVVGASAGGVEALTQLARGLPANFPAAILVVIHISPQAPSLMPDILNRAGPLPAEHAKNGESLRPRRIFLAPPNRHLLVKSGRLLLTLGPKENSARPAVDPLFRTAARAFGPWVVGVVLSGGLDDGTVGLLEIKRNGGVAVVQDPQDAPFPSMPQSAIHNVEVDHVLPLADIPALLAHLARHPVPRDKGAAFMKNPRRNGDGPDISEVGTDALKAHPLPGSPSAFTCPECGGALWELASDNLLRYRCHVGHGYTAEALASAQVENLEDALWSALRALEEHAAMRRRMATRASKGNLHSMADEYEQQAQATEARAATIRDLLVNGKTAARDRAEDTEALSQESFDHGPGSNSKPRRQNSSKTRKSNSRRF
jgi:two-component system chemotaxis response regulator CheB